MKRVIASLWLLATACGSSPEANAAGDVKSLSNLDLARAISQSDELKTAQAAIDQGHAWRGTQVVAPLLRDPQKRTPAALLVAARAAAGWGGGAGWAEVDKLLARETWIDAQFDGEARELLARSALERGVDADALSHATAALRDAKSDPSRSIRLVLLARALERNNFFDSAAAVYGRASETLRPARDWLLLRVAGSESDSTKRAKAFSAVTLPVAKPRIAWTEAQARERFADALGAATRYAALGATVQSLRLRLSVAPDTATRDVVKNGLLTFIRTHSGTSDAKAAVEVLDKGFTSLAPTEELVVARTTAATGPPARAIAAYERALAVPAIVTANDRLQFAQSLARAGRSRDAFAQLDAVQGPLAAQAAFQHARILLTSGTADATRAALREVVSRFPADTAAASSALFLLADLSTDDANDAQARTLYQQLYRTYPTSPRAASARFNAAIIDLSSTAYGPAAQELDSLVALMPRSDEALAARYWSGRAWASAGNPTLAKARWRDVVARQPLSYYSFASAKRLGEHPAGWAATTGSDSTPRLATIDSALTRTALLERLGMDAEARFEYDALDDAATASPERLAATAHALVEHNQVARAGRLAQKLIDAGRKDAPAYRLAYPILDRDELVRDANAHGLEPALVAALIRQESSFNPRAVSVAGARGLMQILPAVGEEVSRALSFPVWYPALLFDPDANLQLGTAHLAGFVKQYETTTRVLAAYNAGGSRVTRWASKAGMDDPELFVERIPFVETRDYVRLVLKNEEIYRELYDWR